MLDLDDLIEQASRLEPLPPSATRLTALVSSGAADIGEIADVVAYDQALTTRLLQAANAAASGGASPVHLARDAVFRLGTARVVALAIASSVKGMLARDLTPFGLAEGQLWAHSVAAAAAAESIHGLAEYPLPTETFTAALLHDIGKLVMSRHLSVEDLEWMHQARTSGRLSRLEAEVEVLGVHHGELGAVVAQHWELPERIVKGILHHHSPAQGFDAICDGVCLANLVAKQLEPRSNVDGPATDLPPPDPDSLDRIGLVPDQMAPLLQAARAQYQAVRGRYDAV